jgi:hypothetical protein
VCALLIPLSRREQRRFQFFAIGDIHCAVGGGTSTVTGIARVIYNLCNAGRHCAVYDASRHNDFLIEVPFQRVNTASTGIHIRLLADLDRDGSSAIDMNDWI